MDSSATHTRIALVGAGFGGLGAAIRLRRAGYRDFLVFDRGSDVGGTWRDNTYPGCACDVPSHLYSLSFAPNPDWSRSFSPQPEIWAYLRRVADGHGVRPHLRLEHEVRAAAWDDTRRVWRLDTSRGSYTAEVLVAAGGPLTEPSVPDLPGLADFRGEVFHSARWRHDLDLTGRRVAVVGTGASAIQFVPRIAPGVAQLTLLQRTPAWVLPRRDRPITGFERAVYRHVPGAQKLARAAVYWARELQGTAFLRPALMRFGQAMARRHLRRSIPDPALRAKLTPAYTMGCKRVLLSNDYYPALNRDNVEVVTEAISRVTPTGVVTADGREHPVDTIIFGTGFHVTDLPMARAIRGADGRTLAEHWDGSMYAYRGATVTGFPNLFLLLGPNTGLGHNSVVFMIEAQLDYLLGALRHLDRTGAPIEPTARAQRVYNDELDRRMRGTVWTSGGCRSWYLDGTGRNSTLWPGYTWSYWLRTRRFDAAAYRSVGATAGRS
ncbi:flavin-containing monooxygenase [Catellatospora tritici]|uniref:flavin-containing monooxygenase n=1 Tax=Catellatospora tritici TaxID=2851566 RepID=UPI001C2CDD2D|nr:NAD(P)/FAD-dependent oxidoreductase [Catellatospora tritici]MBV1850297.1 NAD(P)/FAD-dependent oxidoreductase [Catellatospora tritici]